MTENDNCIPDKCNESSFELEVNHNKRSSIFHNHRNLFAFKKSKSVPNLAKKTKSKKTKVKYHKSKILKLNKGKKMNDEYNEQKIEVNDQLQHVHFEKEKQYESENETNIIDEKEQLISIQDTEYQFKSNLLRASLSFSMSKRDGDYESLFQKAKEMFFEATTAYEFYQSEEFLRYKMIASEQMESAVENGPIELAAQYANFLLENDQLDYNKTGKYLKLAAVKGLYIDCLKNYLNLVKEGKIINDDCADIGKLYEHLYKYESHRNNMNKAQNYFNEAVLFYKIGTELSQPDSIVRYVQLIDEEIISGDKKEALELCKKAANMNHPASMAQYGLMLEKTKLKFNKTKASELFEKAACFNDPIGMFKYAQILEENCMIKSDRLKAIALYKKAADLNHYDAMIKYAKLLEDGQYIKADIYQALKYYKKAADLDNVQYILSYTKI